MDIDSLAIQRTTALKLSQCRSCLTLQAKVIPSQDFSFGLSWDTSGSFGAVIPLCIDESRGMQTAQLVRKSYCVACRRHFYIFWSQDTFFVKRVWHLGRKKKVKTLELLE